MARIGRATPSVPQVLHERDVHLQENGEAVRAVGTSSAPFGGGLRPQDEALATAVAAASHCVDLDGTGDFPADQELGLFELGPSNGSHSVPGGLKVTGGRIHLGFGRVSAEGEGNEVTSKTVGTTPGVVRMSIFMEISKQTIAARATVAEQSIGAENEGVPARSAAEQLVERSQSSPASVNGGDNALLEATAVANWGAGNPSVRVDVVVAYGSQGDWKAVEMMVPLTRSSSIESVERLARALIDGEGGKSSHSDTITMVLTTSLDWIPEEHVWGLLHRPVVADVRVSDTGLPYHDTGPFVHATLCKRATGERTASGIVERKESWHAILKTFVKQNPRARRITSENGGRIYAQVGDEGLPRRRLSTEESDLASVVSEIDDPEWTKEEGRGMDAVHALPRLANWTPGQWRKRQLRRQRQEEERERRQAQRRREKYDGNGSQSRGCHDNDSNRGGGSGAVSSFAKRALDALRRRWRKFGRRKT